MDAHGTFHTIPFFVFAIIVAECEDFYVFAKMFSAWKVGKNTKELAEALDQFDLIRYLPQWQWGYVFPTFIEYASFLGNKDALFFTPVQNLFQKNYPAVDWSFSMLEKLASRGHQISAFAQDIFTILYRRDGFYRAVENLGALINSRRRDPCIQRWLNMLKAWSLHQPQHARLEYCHIPQLCAFGTAGIEGHFCCKGWRMTFAEVRDWTCTNCKVYVLLCELCEGPYNDNY